MVFSRIVVGRAIVDPDDVDIGRFLLSAEDALVRKDPDQVGNDGKGPDRLIDGDETYARQIQNDYLQEVLRVLEDYRYAKSLAGCSDAVDQPEKSSIVDKFAMDYLEALLATSEEQSEPCLAYVPQLPLHLSSLKPALRSPDFVYTTDDDKNSDTGYNDVEDEPIWIPESQSPREAAAEAAERRKLSLSLAISAGLPGPSGRCSSLFSDGPTSEDGEYDQWNPVSENLSSPDDQDNGDGQCGRNAAIYCTDNGDVDGMDNVGETNEQPE
ncbi:hypothetical protein H0H93_009977 [Arthromyces matolae]|nr:hypothetical protein H0H93_009977 [Arthromyces matolae]